MDSETKEYVDDLVRQLFASCEVAIAIITSSIASQGNATQLQGELAKQIHNAEAFGAVPGGLKMARAALKGVEAMAKRQAQP